MAKHLSQLEEAGLVSATGEERRRRFVLTPGPLGDAMTWMTEIGAEWDERLEALKRDVERHRA